MTIVGNEFEAQVVCGLLRDEGIACGYRLIESVCGAEGGEGFAFGGRHEVIVDGPDLQLARELVVDATLEAECVECGQPIGDELGRLDRALRLASRAVDALLGVALSVV